jgi:hypothetical protein
MLELHRFTFGTIGVTDVSAFGISGVNANPGGREADFRSVSAGSRLATGYAEVQAVARSVPMVAIAVLSSSVPVNSANRRQSQAMQHTYA